MLRSIFVLLIMVPGAIWATINRFVALQLYLWFAFFRPQEWLWTDISSLRLSLVLGLILVIPSILTGIFPTISHPLAIGSILFVLLSLPAQFSAVRPDVGWYWIDFMARLILVSLMMITLINGRRRFIWVIALISCCLAFYSAKAGFVSLLGGGIQFSDGLAGAFIDNNGYALAITMTIPLLVAAAQNLNTSIVSQRILQLAFYLSVPFSCFAVISTFSRSGFLAIIAATLIYILLQRRRMKPFLLLFSIVLLVLLVAPIPKGYFGRIRTIQTYEESGEVSAISRFHFWEVAVKMAKEHPFGVGLRNYEYNYDKYDSLSGRYGTKRSVHSSHFQVLAELGIPGIAVYILLFVFAFIIAFRIRARSSNPILSADKQRFFFTSANALIVSMSSFIVGGAFIALALNDLTWITFALIAVLDRLFKRELLAETI
jgi:putative inorganic carbon (hco3(-)) transporter